MLRQALPLSTKAVRVHCKGDETRAWLLTRGAGVSLCILWRAESHPYLRHKIHVPYSAQLSAPQACGITYRVYHSPPPN
jgi:hypothetical protein